MSRTIFCIAATIFFAVPLHAAEIKWGRGTAAGNFVGNFTDTANWDGGVLPGPDDRARVDRGSTDMTLDSTIVVNQFFFGVDEAPQLFTFLETADVSIASNFFAAFNRGGVTVDIQEGVSVSVGGNFLLGQFDNANMTDSDITVMIAGNVDNSTGKTLIGDQYDGEALDQAILTDLLLDVSGTLTTRAVEFAPNGDLDAFLNPIDENSMHVRVADAGLISLQGDKTGIVQEQIDAGFYFTDSTEGTLQVRYDMGIDRTLVEVRTGTAPVCDFNGDEACDIADLNLMLNEGPIAPGVTTTPGVNDQYDLNGDGQIDLDDQSQWLSDAATENGLSSAYKSGDANLDAVVDVPDFNAWNSNKFTSTLNWDNGDFNGDGAVDVSDFNSWNGNKFTSSTNAAVPEPTSAMLLLVATLFGIFVKGRRPC